jgi:large-conductance mechanosensitive channel
MINKIEKIADIKPLHHINKEVGGFFGRLLSFLKEYSVIGVAIGVIVAQSAKEFVDNMVKGIFIPLFNLLVPNNEISNWTWTIRGIKFNFGTPFISLVTLLIIITFLYLIFKRVIKQSLLEKKEDEKK